MAVELGPRFLPTFEGIPPHISSEDFRLWERWRKRVVAQYVAFYFDVALGRGEDVGPVTTQKLRDAWRRLTRFRADVVGDTGAEWHIVELRPNAGPGAVGAVQTYLTLWGEGPPDARPVRALIVTDRCSEDIKVVARLVGIEVVCLGEE